MISLSFLFKRPKENPGLRHQTTPIHVIFWDTYDIRLLIGVSICRSFSIFFPWPRQYLLTIILRFFFKRPKQVRCLYSFGWSLSEGFLMLLTLSWQKIPICLKNWTICQFRVIGRAKVEKKKTKDCFCKWRILGSG